MNSHMLQPTINRDAISAGIAPLYGVWAEEHLLGFLQVTSSLPRNLYRALKDEDVSARSVLPMFTVAAAFQAMHK